MPALALGRAAVGPSAGHGANLVRGRQQLRQKHGHHPPRRAAGPDHLPAQGIPQRVVLDGAGEGIGYVAPFPAWHRAGFSSVTVQASSSVSFCEDPGLRRVAETVGKEAPREPQHPPPGARQLTRGLDVSGQRPVPFIGKMLVSNVLLEHR